MKQAAISATPADAGDRKTPPKKRARIHRPSSDTARFHMSNKAVDRSVQEYAKWSNLKAVKHFAKVRWGDSEVVSCPHCQCSTKHYFSQRELRWKCKGCGKRFSVTSGTVFANHRLPLQTLLAAMHIWASGAAGQPALELRRMLNLKGYNTAFTLVSKIREALVRGFNTGLISGTVEMDGAHASGRRASEKRGRPLNYRDAEEVKKEEEAVLLTTSARQKKRREEKQATLAAGGVVHPEHGAAFPATRRIVFTARRRSGVPGRGAVNTRVAVGLMETPDVVEAFAAKYVAVPESVLATDTGTAFSAAGKKFLLHMQVNHSETMSDGGGQHVNFSESFSARQDRSEKGVYLNIEPKYLHDYAVETAFREDHRRMAPGAVADQALHHALNVGHSLHWRGFTHGKHRSYEMRLPESREAEPSGPKKGRSPIRAANGLAPR